MYFGYGVSLLGFFKVGFCFWFFFCLGDGIIVVLLVVVGGWGGLVVFVLFLGVCDGGGLMVVFLFLIVWDNGGLFFFVVLDVICIDVDVLEVLFFELFVDFCN